jgi:hypothetical protein
MERIKEAILNKDLKSEDDHPVGRRCCLMGRWRWKARIVVGAIPVMIFYAFIYRRIVGGLVAGSVKG